ncbi:hypothetical protein Tco_0404572 [Tanacetum coccineum]
MQEHINKEERQRIARDAEIAKQLQEEINTARQEQEKEVVAEADPAHVIDWSDPTVLRYHTLQNRSFSVAEVRKNMCIVWDQNHAFVPKDSDIEKEVMKRPGFDLQQKSIKKSDKIEEKEKKIDNSSKPAGGSRKKTLAKKRTGGKDSEESVKKQKLEDDAEKEELKLIWI